MKMRIALTSTLLLVVATGARSQDAPTFALDSTAIRQIVRDTAATQFGEPLVPAAAVAAPKDDVTLEPVPLTHAMPEKAPAQPKTRPQARRSHDGPISALVDLLIDEALGIEDVMDVDTPYDDWLRCPARAEDMVDVEIIDACPGRQSAWGLTQPLGYQSPEIRAR